MKPEAMTLLPIEERADSAWLSPPERLGAECFADALVPSMPTRSVRLESAYQEYCEKLAAGQAVDAEEFCEKFPDLRDSLRLLMHAHAFLDENPSLLQDFSCAPLDDDAIRWPEPQETFLHYRLLLELGRGAFARVFLAADLKLGERLVALKIARSGGEEAQILGPIDHPNIVLVHSTEKEEGTGLTAVCMPYVGSATLHTVLEKISDPANPLARAQWILDAVKELPDSLARPTPATAPPPPILRTGTYVDGVRFLGAKLANALAYLHERGIHHLDLKPSNVLLRPDGVPLILDFNLAEIATKTNRLPGGTLLYMSPEQLRQGAQEVPANRASPQASSDVFSLGILLYRLLTGNHPFDPGSATGSTSEMCRLFLQRQREGSVPVCRANPRVDRALGELVQDCLAFDPAQRPRSAALAAALERSLRPQARARRWIGLHPRIVTAVFLSLLSAVLVAIAVGIMRPSYSERQFEAGIEAYKQKQFQMATHSLTQALEADPNFAAAYFARGRANQQQGAAEEKKYRSALDDYDKVFQIAPDGKTKACMGYCLDRLGQSGRGAGVCYEEAIEHGYGNAKVLNNLGYSRLLTHDLKGAQDCLDQALQLDPSLQAAWHNRARLHQERAIVASSGKKTATPEEDRKRQIEIMRHLETSIADIEKALELGPADAELYCSVLRIYAIALRTIPDKKGAVSRHLIEAKKHSISPSKLKKDRSLTSLCDLPQFQELLLSKAPEVSDPQPTRRVVDPVKDDLR